MGDMEEKERSRDSGRDRDRSRRGDRPSRFSEASGVRDRSGDRGGGRKSSNCRVYVSNISYEYRWQDLKDLFRDNVGDVSFVELFVDEHDKPKGCGIVEFSDPSLVKKCMEVMHRFDLKGRKLVIKEDFGNERDKYGNIINGRRNRDRDRHLMDKDWDDVRESRRGGGGASGGHSGEQAPPSLLASRGGGGDTADFKWGNTYGLSPQFLESLNINRPLVNRVFVANLDYKVDEKKLREVFKLCGKVVDVELYHDKDGNSRGFAVVEFDHPVESVQAISMLHNQLLYERQMTVRMDRVDNDAPIKLPEGLKGVGMGLGMNGEPLRDVSRNLPSAAVGVNVSGVSAGTNNGPGILGAVPTPAGLQALTSNLGGSSTASAAAALSSVVSNPTLAGLNPIQFLGNNSLGDLGLSALNPNLNPSLSSQLSSQLGSLQQNHLVTLNNSGLPPGMASNISNSVSSGALMAGRLVASDREYSRGDGGGGAPFLMGPGQSGAGQQQEVGNSGGGGGMGREYSSGNSNRDYDPSNSMRSYEKMSKDLQDNYRQGNIMYSTVNNGSQGRSSGNNMSVSKGNGFSDIIIVSNLPISATWKMLREKFSNAGDVQYVEMKTKDTAIIRYATEWQAERAIKLMDRVRLDGRTLDVRFYY